MTTTKTKRTAPRRKETRKRTVTVDMYSKRRKRTEKKSKKVRTITRWYTRLIGSNGNIMLSSESNGYSSRKAAVSIGVKVGPAFEATTYKLNGKEVELPFLLEMID